MIIIKQTTEARKLPNTYQTFIGIAGHGMDANRERIDMEYGEFNWERPASLASFGAALRRRREGLGLTLDALARATGISKPYLSNIETARAPGPPSEEK